MNGYKILTEDNCSPIQYQDPLFLPNTVFPYTLPTVNLDTSSKKCGEGWNFCKDVKIAFQVVGICGRIGINKIYKVKGSSDSIVRNNKIRCSSLTILEPVSSFEDFKNIEELNNKQRELFDWFNLKLFNTENNSKIIRQLSITLHIKNMKDWTIIRDNRNFILTSYYNYNYYNYYYNYYNYYYYYIVESLFEPNQNYRKALVEAYKNGMRQLKFDTIKKQLIYLTKSQL